MINKAIKFLILLAIVAIALYVVNINPTPLTIALSHSYKVTANAGLIFIGVFMVGFITAAFIATFFGVRAFFRERRLERRERQHRSFYGEMIKARALSSAKLWDKAEDYWSKLIKKDPTDIIARSELAECLIQTGKNKEALKVLDDARTVDPQNPEVLLKAANLNISLNNKTAAIDNLALLLYHHPSAHVAALARNLSEDLGRVDDAYEYHKQFMQMNSNNQENHEISARLEYKKYQNAKAAEYHADPSEAKNYKKRIKELKSFLKKYPDYALAIYDLAKVHEELGEIDRAAQLLISAAKITSSPAYWQEAAKLWIDNNMADNALLVINAVAREARGAKKIDAQLVYIKTLIALNKLETAREELKNINDLAQQNDIEIPQDLARDILILKGLCLNRMGQYKESAQIWKRLSKHDFKLDLPEFKQDFTESTDAPEARLSTP